MYTGSLSAEETVKAQQRELEALRAELFDKKVNLFIISFHPSEEEVHVHRVDNMRVNGPNRRGEVQRRRKPSCILSRANTIGKHFTNIHRAPFIGKLYTNKSTLLSPTITKKIERKTRLAFLLPPGTPHSPLFTPEKQTSILSFFFEGAVQEWVVRKLRKLTDKLLLKVAVRVLWRWGKELV